MSRELTLVDAGLGNLSSVERALVQVGSGVRTTTDPDVVARSRMVVFPGQGAFGKATEAVTEGMMGEAIRMVIQRGDPFLGICIGMQLLFDSSEEADGTQGQGLGVLRGTCKRFPSGMTCEERGEPRQLKVPHVGWNGVEPSGDHYYFVHSYYVDAKDASDVLWTATYGDVKFAAAVKKDNIYGCQFHPEKSQQAGLRFLRGFILGAKS